MPEISTEWLSEAMDYYGRAPRSSFGPCLHQEYYQDQADSYLEGETPGREVFMSWG